MKPTKEQVKKFWEWCGFQKIENPLEMLLWIYLAPDKNYLSLKGYPEIDLDHLGLIFKYAVPKLKILGYDCLISTSEDFYECEICDSRFPPVKQAQLKQDKDPALALFWAIYKVIEEETET